MASHCPSGQHHRDATELHLHSRELFTSSPRRELLDELQKRRFKYNTEKCAWAGRPPSRKPPMHPEPFQTSSAPSLPTACCQTLWSIPHCPPVYPWMLPPLTCSPGTLLSATSILASRPPSMAQLKFQSLLMKHPQEMSPSSTRLYVILSPVNLAGGPAEPALGSASAAESPALRESRMG